MGHPHACVLILVSVCPHEHALPCCTACLAVPKVESLHLCVLSVMQRDGVDGQVICSFSEEKPVPLAKVSVALIW